MKIPPKDIEQFLKSIPANTKAMLLYGPDAGLVKIRADAIKKSYSFAGDFNYEQVKDNPYILADNLRSIGLFEAKSSQTKIIVIETSSASISSKLKEFLEKESFSGLLLFLAGDLGTDSALRKFFETNLKEIAAIPCYQDDIVAVSKLIQKFFKDKQVIIQPSAIQLILNSIALGDRIMILNELEKISLFLDGKNNITDKDLEDYLDLQGEANFDKLCYKMSLKEVSELEALLLKLQNDGNNLVSIVRVLIRHFFRLYQVKSLIIQGSIEQEAMASLSPPVFFKQVQDFGRSVKLWSDSELFNLLKSLNEIELMAKQNLSMAELHLKKIFLKPFIGQ